ncbi:MAG: hypothetical protein ACLTR5_07075 [Oscillospiraceae bacterium]
MPSDRLVTTPDWNTSMPTCVSASLARMQSARSGVSSVVCRTLLAASCSSRSSAWRSVPS